MVDLQHGQKRQKNLSENSDEVLALGPGFIYNEESIQLLSISKVEIIIFCV